MSSLSLDQFYYCLPRKLIAHQPLTKRDQSKLIVLNRLTGEIRHQRFFHLPDLLQPNDVLVRNNSKVIPARLFGYKPTGGKVEILLSQPLNKDWTSWECLTKPGLRKTTILKFPNSDISAQVTGNQLEFCGNFKISQELAKIGHTPLPPYIKTKLSEAEQRDRYQTIYAANLGSVAAPTAGLHFTQALDRQLITKGVEILEVDLHVGLGTFLPVKTHDITQHQMHSEWFCLTKKVADRLNLLKQNHQRIIAVGTTSLRVLESCVDQDGQLVPQAGQTNIFIYPPYQFRFVDGLITNFHLPHTTLLMLVSAFTSKPNTNIDFVTFEKSLVGQAYATAIEQKYRFYSFGDSMLIL